MWIVDMIFLGSPQVDPRFSPGCQAPKAHVMIQKPEVISTREAIFVGDSFCEHTI